MVSGCFLPLARMVKIKSFPGAKMVSGYFVPLGRKWFPAVFYHLRAW
jgi:hypothetical protein